MRSPSLRLAGALSALLLACGGDSDGNGGAGDDSGHSDDAGAGGDTAGAGDTGSSGDASGADTDASGAPDLSPDGNGADSGAPTCPMEYLVGEDHQSDLPADLCPSSAVRLIVLGDSISAGTGASRGSLRYSHLLMENDSEQWPGYDEMDLTSLFPGIELVDVSFGGATTTTLRSNQLPDLAAQLGDSVSGHSIAVVTIGGNDVLSGILDPDGEVLSNAVDNIAAMIAFLSNSTRFPDGVSIYFATVYEPSNGVGQVATCFGGAPLQSVLDALETRWVEEYVSLGHDFGAGVIDMIGHFRSHGFYADDTSNEFYAADDPTVWFDPDCIHPNDRGHHEIRKLFYEAIARDWNADSMVP